jgi:hypothetical protein
MSWKEDDFSRGNEGEGYNGSSMDDISVKIQDHHWDLVGIRDLYCWTWRDGGDSSIWKDGRPNFPRIEVSSSMAHSDP